MYESVDRQLSDTRDELLLLLHRAWEAPRQLASAFAPHASLTTVQPQVRASVFRASSQLPRQQALRTTLQRRVQHMARLLNRRRQQPLLAVGEETDGEETAGVGHAFQAAAERAMEEHAEERLEQRLEGPLSADLDLLLTYHADEKADEKADAENAAGVAAVAAPPSSPNKGRGGFGGGGSFRRGAANYKHSSSSQSGAASAAVEKEDPLAPAWRSTSAIAGEVRDCARAGATVRAICRPTEWFGLMCADSAPLKAQLEGRARDVSASVCRVVVEEALRESSDIAGQVTLCWACCICGSCSFGLVLVICPLHFLCLHVIAMHSPA